MLPGELVFLTRVLYRAAYDEEWGEHEVDYCLLVRSDGAFSARPEEVAETKFVTAADLRVMLGESAFVFA